jgi:hypothetical protein
LNIFKLQQQFNRVKNDVKDIGTIANSYLDEANLELSKLQQSAYEKNLKYLLFNLNKEEGAVEAFKAIHPNIVESNKDVLTKRSYNVFNFLVAIRRYYRAYNVKSAEYGEIKADINVVYDELKELEQELSKSSVHPRVSSLLDELIKLKEGLAYLRHFTFKLYDFVETMRNNFHLAKVPKHDLLQVITVVKDKQTRQIIEQLPDKLDFDELMKHFFVEVIEDPDDCMLTDMIFDHVMDKVEGNKEMKEEMDKRMNEVMGGIQKYNVTFDRFGDVMNVEHAKPELSLV